MQVNERYMRRCIELARYGQMHAAPNPMVGAVIVHGDRIIGEGYHAVCGKGHAEVNAIASVRAADRALLCDSTMYVSLEPCAHYGKTPPCARLIVKTGIPRVVVGCVDPFAKVQGRGIAILREAGVEVEVGVLDAECRALNRRFITAQTKRRPYITLKWARSADGFIDRWRDEAEGEAAARLSSEASLMRVHQLRAMHQAILVGHNTLRMDRPQLNVRHWAGNQPPGWCWAVWPRANCLRGGWLMPTLIRRWPNCTALRGCSRCWLRAGSRRCRALLTRGCGTRLMLSFRLWCLAAVCPNRVCRWA